jgi:hypothetical protein
MASAGVGLALVYRDGPRSLQQGSLIVMAEYGERVMELYRRYASSDITEAFNFERAVIVCKRYDPTPRHGPFAPTPRPQSMTLAMDLLPLLLCLKRHAGASVWPAFRSPTQCG